MWKALFLWMAFDGTLHASFKALCVSVLSIFLQVPERVWAAREFEALASLEACTAAALILLPACALAKRLRFVRIHHRTG